MHCNFKLIKCEIDKAFNDLLVAGKPPAALTALTALTAARGRARGCRPEGAVDIGSIASSLMKCSADAAEAQNSLVARNENYFNAQKKKMKKKGGKIWGMK